MQIVGQTWLNLVTWTCGSWSEDQHDLYFMVQWFCLISWRLFDVCTSYFQSMNQYDPVWPKNKCRSLWPIFHGSVIVPYILKTTWASLFGIMNQYDLMHDLKINVGHCDLYFTVQWFCLISWRLVDVCTSYFRSMNQYDPTFDLKINVGHCDLYFMVQWLCLIPWRLFHVGTSLFGIMNQYDPTHDVKINIGYRDLYFMVQWFYVISWRLFGDYGSVWLEVWPLNKFMSLSYISWFTDFPLYLKDYLMDECLIFRWDSVTQTLTSK